MNVAFLCPHCSRENVGETPAVAAAAACAHCRRPIDLAFTPSMLERNLIDRCAVCGNDRLYVQKDFNRRLGVAILAAGVALSYVFFGFNLPALILGLTACVGVDFLLYKMLPEVTVCYACQSIYRGYARNPQHQPFDLHVAEEYERR